ncbi:MAG: glutamate-1-semialdehyde 2,1-aminomutase [Bacteroidota bacterium]
MNIKNSEELFRRAEKYIPGGVNSPVRAFRGVGGTPVFMKTGFGSRMADADGNVFIDYIGSWGPHLFGHNPEFLKEALLIAIENGTSFGAPSESEVIMAETISRLVPSVEQVRMVNSGTEATMSAVRVARGFTGKNKIIKFEGCYHGHADFFLIKAGSGALTLGQPTSPGVTPGNAADTLLAVYNQIDTVERLVEANKGEIAAVIIEPVAGNMGLVNMDREFLRRLQEICRQENIVLIFDEVMTGFRVARGGAQEIFGVKPDMTTFGKIIGGGLPVGAFGGRREIMEMVAPAGPVYQAGTLSGNPLAMSAGLAMLQHIEKHPEIYDVLEEKSAYLEKGFTGNLRQLGRNFAFNRQGSMMCMFFTEEKVDSYESVMKSDTALYSRYFYAMLERGIYLAPSQFEVMFLSTAHTYDDLDATISAHFESLKEIL